MNWHLNIIDAGGTQRATQAYPTLHAAMQAWLACIRGGDITSAQLVDSSGVERAKWSKWW